ncbi:NAD-binding protein [Streptomyces sp. MUM 203J]|uniref:NAD-binding protein n=1 Tax=Streptomyces sp. MUM 203J TaxID=2791990 RepID=UPI001F0412D6|nr:NAD(P)-binding protein [Streptomyces sp. MUM 203J]MCH0543300.1 NAD-binding protein [Streptomyces sp. MUM 203J]
MVVCGDDALADRLAHELNDVYGERVTLVVPGRGESAPADGSRPRPSRSAFALFGRMTAAVTRPAAGPYDRAGDGRTGPAGRAGHRGGGAPTGHTVHGPGTGEGVRVLEVPEADEAALLDAGVERAAALALVYEDDDTNIRAALLARRLNPAVRLVIRMYNRKLGQHLEELLDQAAALALPGIDPEVLDASTTVLSDADTAAPALAATAVAGTSKIVHADGLLLRAVERTPSGRGEVADPGLCPLALLSSTANDPAGSDGSDSSGEQGPRLLPDDRAVAAATGRGMIALEAVSYAGPTLPAKRLGRAAVPFGSLFSPRLRWSFAGLVAAVTAIAVATAITTDTHPLHAAYITLLDLFAINDPALEDDKDRQILQILTGFLGLLLLPMLVAAILEALGTFRTATALRRPPRGLSGHVVLLGLGKVGTRVLRRLRELDIPVVCVESDPEARGIATARRLRVPVVLGDVTEEGVLEAARVHKAHSLLALTSLDITNLEAVLYARSLRPDLRVVLRLYDDDIATAVYRTLRVAHPEALTRSRSVSHLAAPAFAGAMMGRQILGAIPVERRVLLFAAVVVAGHPELEGRTVAEAFRPGAWRVVALDPTAPDQRRPDLAAVRTEGGGLRRTGLVWDLHPGYVLRAEDRVVLAATRLGLAELLGRRAPGPTP